MNQYRDLMVPVPSYGRARVTALAHNLRVAAALLGGPTPIYDAVVADLGSPDQV